MRRVTAAAIGGLALGALLAGTAPLPASAAEYARDAEIPLDLQRTIDELDWMGPRPWHLDQLLRVPSSRLRIRCWPSGPILGGSASRVGFAGPSHLHVTVFGEREAEALRHRLIFLDDDHPLHENAVRMLDDLKWLLQACIKRRIFGS